MGRPATLSQEFAQAYRAYVDFVWRVLARRGVPDELLEDATQEVFVIMYRRWGAWGSEPPRAWLYGVARRVASTQHRTGHRRQRKLAALAAEPPPSDNAFDERDRLDALAQALDQLAPEHREVVVLVDVEGLSAPEAATALDCKLNTVYSRLRRARATIARVMARHEAELEPSTKEDPDGPAR